MARNITRLLLGMTTGAWLTPCAFAQATATSDSTQTVDEVVVTGTNRAMPTRLLPYTVTTIDSRQIQQTGRTQLLAALQGVPSLFARLDNIANQSYMINNGYDMPGLTINGGFKLRF